MPHRVTFLIVDDDIDDREMLQEAIVEMLPQVTFMSAGNGLEAMSLLADTEISPDVIFLDINMPRMNGLQFIENFKNIEKCRNIPVVVYSTSGYQEHINQSLQHGAACFFIKPSSFAILKKELKKIFSQFSL